MYGIHAWLTERSARIDEDGVAILNVCESNGHTDDDKEGLVMFTSNGVETITGLRAWLQNMSNNVTSMCVARRGITLMVIYSSALYVYVFFFHANPSKSPRKYIDMAIPSFADSCLRLSYFNVFS